MDRIAFYQLTTNIGVSFRDPDNVPRELPKAKVLVSLELKSAKFQHSVSGLKA